MLTAEEIKAERSRIGGNEVCPACGWSCKKVWEYSNDACAPAMGAAARALIDKLSTLPNVRGWQNGFGFGVVWFEIGTPKKHVTLSFDIDAKGRLSLECVFGVNRQTPEAVVAMVEFFAALGAQR